MRINGISSPNRLCRVIILGLLFVNIGCVSSNGWAMNRSGMRQYSRGHFVQARNRFARAVAENPRNGDYRYNLAMSIQKQGDAVASEKILRHNLTINAMHQPTYHSLAQTLVNQGRTAEAQDLLGGWVATQPYVPEANIEMAWLQRETGDVAGAEQSLQQALKVKPTHPVALAHLGQLYQSTGRPDMAANYYQRSLAANWDQPEVQSRLATLTEPQYASRSRSAMMQNSAGGPMMAGNPNVNDNGMMVSQSFVSDPMIAGGAMMNGDAMLTGYPVAMNDPMTLNSPMMMNDPMMAGTQINGSTPMLAMSPPMATGVPFGNDPSAVALEDVTSNPEPRRRRRKKDREKDKEKEEALATYPLPNFDGATTAWVPSGTISGQTSMTYQSTTIGFDQMALPQPGNPQMAVGTYSPTPINGYSPGLVPQADPAHFYASGPEMTASLPVVDPH